MPVTASGERASGGAHPVTGNVTSGYAHSRRPTVEELTLRLEAARDAERAACSRYCKLRGAVLAWAEARGLEAEGPHLHALLREVGKWPEASR